ncbi:MAG: methyltransferase domain-containing protein [Lachnospiraceae bacterium]|nr:methyltransferase domain-containing protein [Lachnospiraceae bacterium]
MSKELVPFWEKSYQEYDTIAFSNEPNVTITEFEHLINDQSKILEAGCGEGQNAIYLAKQGHHVDAFDLSEYGIAKLKHRCELADTQVNAFVADLTAYQFMQHYDMVICFGTLHFVEKDEWRRFIINAKEYTNIGGIHIIQIFTDTVPASEDIAPFAIGLAKDEELKELYTDWEILQFKSYVFEDEHPNVPKHLHASNKIVARRIR